MKHYTLLILSFLFTIQLNAQQSFSGTIVSETKENIAGALIQTKSKTFSKQVISKSDGSFFFLMYHRMEFIRLEIPV